jgi:hypothetical protein
MTAADRREEATGPSVKDMQAKIGQLALENDFCASSEGWRIQRGNSPAGVKVRAP